MTLVNKYYLYFILLTITSCGGVSYTFKSTDIPQNAKTIAIMQFYNESTGGPSNLSQLFTEKVRDYFQNNTKLTIVADPSDADLILAGAITNYEVNPDAPSANGNGEQAAQQRMIITVQASYTNTISSDDKSNFSDQRFQSFALFDSEKNLSDVETAKIEEISDLIVVQIFTKSFDNW